MPGNDQNKIINGQKVADFRSMRALQGRSVETVARDIQVAINAINYCIEDLDWDLNNPFSRRKYGKKDRQKVRPRDRTLSGEEEKALFKSIPLLNISDDYKLLLHSLLRFYLETGMRANEALGLERKRVLDDVAFMGWDDHKGGYFDGRYLNHMARKIIARQPEHDQYVFSRKGQRVSYDWLKKPFARLKEKAGITDFVLHDLRRTSGERARLLFGLEYAQALLGHKDQSTTERQYTPVSADICRVIQESALPYSETQVEGNRDKGNNKKNQGDMVPGGRFELPTYALRMRRSTN